MAINSKRKGNQGENELKNILIDKGFEAKRMQQYCGYGGVPDVEGLEGIHIEVKRVEKLNIDDALDQATRDCKEGRIPVVFHRKNKKKWKATLDLDMFMMLYGEYYSSMVLSNREDK